MEDEEFRKRLNENETRVSQSKEEIVDGKITLTFYVGDEWITKKQAQEMIDRAIQQVMAEFSKFYSKG